MLIRSDRLRARRRFGVGLRRPTCGHVRKMCNAGIGMRDAEIIETELVEISTIADDLVKFERIVTWCTMHPDEVPFALHHLMKQKPAGPAQDSKPAPDQA